MPVIQHCGSTFNSFVHEYWSTDYHPTLMRRMVWTCGRSLISSQALVVLRLSLMGPFKEHLCGALKSSTLLLSNNWKRQVSSLIKILVCGKEFQRHSEFSTMKNNKTEIVRRWFDRTRGICWFVQSLSLSYLFLHLRWVGKQA